MSERRPPMIDALNARLEESEQYNYITCDADLQREACEKLRGLLDELAALKQEAIVCRDENMANTFLGYECAASFLRSSMEMWLLLKAGNPDEAWDELINAQASVADGVRAHPGFAHLAKFAKRLHAFETLLFPPQKFTSFGMIVRSKQCSICGGEYGECDHLIGKPYMGRICHTIVTEIEELNHLAFAEHPADKHARIVSIRVEGGKKNWMTRKVEPDPSGEARGRQPGEPLIVEWKSKLPYNDFSN